MVLQDGPQTTKNGSDSKKGYLGYLGSTGSAPSISHHLSMLLLLLLCPVAALRLMVRTEQSQVSSVAELLAALIVHTAR